MDKSKCYFDIIRDWLYFVPFEPRAKPVHTALFLKISDQFNVHFYPKLLGVPTNYTMTALNIGSYNTYKKALLELEEFGFIKIAYRAKNQHMANRIELSFFDKAYDKARDKATDKAGAKAIDEPTDSVVNLKTKELKNLKTNSIVSIETQELETTCLTFDQFYDLYDKKRGGEAAKKKFKNTTESDREKMKIHIPMYKQANEKQFRKDPAAYLNQKAWNDEIINRNTQTNQGYQTANERRQQKSKEVGEQLMQQLIKNANGAK